LAVIVLDANIVLYAYDSIPREHLRAKVWLQDVFSGDEPVGLAWQTIAAFLRLITDTRLPGHRFTSREAVEVVDQWLELPCVRLLTPGEGHWLLLRRMVEEGRASGRLVSDAEIAALTIEYGGVLYTTDRDFARFPGLRWKNPLS
jgi:toxin-antitoxin system PIN domain toxin